MASDTKTLILDQHQANQDLNTPLLPQVTRSDNDLAAEDMRSPLDEQIIAGAMEALESGQTHYVDVPGIAPLRDTLADYLNGFNRTQFEQGNIVVTAGMQESRFLSIQKIGEMYASVAVPAVVHPGARKALGVRNRHPQAIPVEQAKGYLPTIEAIAEAVSGRQSPALSGVAIASERRCLFRRRGRRHLSAGQRKRLRIDPGSRFGRMDRWAICISRLPGRRARTYCHYWRSL